MKQFLRAMSRIFFVLAGLAFLVGGRVINAATRNDRALAEMEGIGLAFLFGLIGFTAHSWSESLDDGES